MFFFYKTLFFECQIVIYQTDLITSKIIICLLALHDVYILFFYMYYYFYQFIETCFKRNTK